MFFILRDMAIGRKIGLGFVVVLLLLAGVAGLTVAAMERLSSQSFALQALDEQMVLAQQAQVDYATMRQQTARYVAVGDPAARDSIHTLVGGLARTGQNSDGKHG